MKHKNSKHPQGIELLVKKYRGMFQTPENLNHYSREDYKIAEKCFIKCALAGKCISVPWKEHSQY
jgi:hypothetical protein